MWVFDYWHKNNINPLNNGYLSINATEQRTGSFYSQFSTDCLIEWNNSYGYYSTNVTNASIEFNFLKQPIFIKKYRLLPIKGSCSPNGLTLEGSFDGIEYYTLDYADRICSTIRCTEKNEFRRDIHRNNKMYFRYLKFVETEGECEGQYLYFGLNSVDFYVSYGYKLPTCGLVKNILLNKFTLLSFIVIQ